LLLYTPRPLLYLPSFPTRRSSDLFPNREALLDLYSSIVDEPGVEQHVLSHATIAPFVVDPGLIRKLSEELLPKSPLHLPAVSTRSEEHTSELQSRVDLVCRLLLEK